MIFITKILTAIAVAAVIAVAVAFYRSGLKKYAKPLLLCLVRSAEQSYGAKTGELKYCAVASKLYEIMPPAFKYVFSQRCISVMIEDAVDSMKRLLSDGKDAETNSEDDHEQE